MKNTWLITQFHDHYDFYNLYHERRYDLSKFDDADLEIKEVFGRFDNEAEAMEEFYTMHMREILNRNEFGRFTTLLMLESHGCKSIVSKHGHSVTRKELQDFAFQKDANKALFREMMIFYDLSDAYKRKFPKAGNGWYGESWGS